VSTSEEQAYVVYWPEDATWDDRAASPVQRNRDRVTFMRYLNKLCDQLVCLLSSELSRALVWGNDDSDKADEEGDGDDDGTSTDSETTDSERFFRFQVAKTHASAHVIFVIPTLPRLRDSSSATHNYITCTRYYENR